MFIVKNAFVTCYSSHPTLNAFWLILYSGSMLEAWTGYIAMELELGHINEARSIYKRCYSKRFFGTGSEVHWASLISINIGTLFYNFKCKAIAFIHKFELRPGALLQHNSLVCCIFVGELSRPQIALNATCRGRYKGFGANIEPESIQ